jgi:hypothetical protein
MINFVDEGGKAGDPNEAAANLDLIHALIAGTNVPDPGADYWGAGPHIYFPPGEYHFSGPIRIRKAVRLQGSSAGTRANYNTMFTFPADTQGLVLDNQDTDNLAYLPYDAEQTSGAGTRIEGINFRGSSTKLGDNHGLLLRTFAVLRDVQVGGFGGHGIYVRATLPQPDTPLADRIGGQASNSQFYDCGAAGNARSGLMIEGGDASAIQVVGGDFSNNGDWGVCDRSGLGCTFTGIHTTQNAQKNSGYRSGATNLVIHPAGSGQIWAIRESIAAAGSTVTPGTNENVWTRYHEAVSDLNMPPNWTSGIAVRPGGPFNTAGPTAWSVWTGCYSEGNQGPSQMGPKAIVIGGDHGSGIQAVSNETSGEPVWMDSQFGELVLKSNLRVKSLYLGHKPVRPNGSAGMKMSAAAAAPTAGAPYTGVPYIEGSWGIGDIVWNQARATTQNGALPPLGWRCIDRPSSFEEIPFPTAHWRIDYVANRGSFYNLTPVNMTHVIFNTSDSGFHRVYLQNVAVGTRIKLSRLRGGHPIDIATTDQSQTISRTSGAPTAVNPLVADGGTVLLTKIADNLWVGEGDFVG